jgi:hypothetical protein
MPPKDINGQRFDDLGNMIEYNIFGGITEHSEHINDQPFGLDELLLLPFAGDPNLKTVYRVDMSTIHGKAEDIKTIKMEEKIKQEIFCSRRGKNCTITSCLGEDTGLNVSCSPNWSDAAGSASARNDTEIDGAPRADYPQPQSEEEDDEDDDEEGYDRNPMSKYAVE